MLCELVVWWLVLISARSRDGSIRCRITLVLCQPTSAVSLSEGQRLLCHHCCSALHDCCADCNMQELFEPGIASWAPPPALRRNDAAKVACCTKFATLMRASDNEARGSRVSRMCGCFGMSSDNLSGQDKYLYVSHTALHCTAA